MPSFPTIRSERSVEVGAPDSYFRGGVSAEALGAGIGGALQGFGDQLSRTARAADALMRERKNNKRDERIANAIAQTDLTTPALQARADAPPDGEGVARRTLEEQRRKIDENADIYFGDDDEARTRFKTHMYGRLSSWQQQQVQFEYSQGETWSREQANLSLDTLRNKVLTDVNTYDEAVEDADRLIDTMTSIPSAAKQGMKAGMRSDLARARFEAALGSASSITEYDAIESELQNERWQTDMSADTYRSMRNAVRVAKNQFMTQADAEARAALDSAEARSTAGVAVPMDEMRAIADLAQSTRSPTISIRLAKLKDEQALISTFGRMAPSHIGRAAEEYAGGLADNAVARIAADASALTNGVIPASFLLGTLSREYSPEDIAQGNYAITNKAGASSATGLFQFIDSTWLEMMNSYAAKVGVDTTGMSREQILALRGDPGLSTKMAALYAAENSKYLQRVLGINPNSTELYLAHFLGKAGAASFLMQMQANADAPITASGSFSEAQIGANRSVFYKKDGTVRTYREVYENMSSSFGPTQTGAQFDRVQFLQRMQADKEKAVRDDPMMQANKDGIVPYYDLQSEEDFTRRGRDAMQAANYYGVALPEMKPFTATEAQQLEKRLKEGTSDDVLAVMAQIQAMNVAAPGMADAAYKQLNEESGTVAYAAGLMYDRGEAAAAAQIVRGQKRLDEDKSLRTSLGLENEDLNAFYGTVGGALSQIDDAQRSAILNAARAHYVETYGARLGVQKGVFDRSAFEKSVQAVLGAQEAVADVNGEPTLIPPGITGREFDEAVDYMTDEDLLALSEDNKPPVDIEGQPFTASDIRAEGKFRAIGGNQYVIEMADGNIATLREPDPQAPWNNKAFVFIADPARIKQIAQRGSPGTALRDNNPYEAVR